MEFTVQLPEKLGGELKTKPDPNSFIVKAVEQALELDQWQLEQIDKGIEAANRGEFVPESQVKAFFNKWGVDEA
jgi:predicted transcriptional regulator